MKYSTPWHEDTGQMKYSTPLHEDTGQIKYSTCHEDTEI